MRLTEFEIKSIKQAFLETFEERLVQLNQVAIEQLRLLLDYSSQKIGKTNE